ncbi:phosphatidylserine decarboxylase family protein [Flavobacteriaceae bacterium M23B6Z8]
MFHKEGHKIILFSLLAAIAISICAFYFIEITWLRMLIQVAALIFLVLILQFFRNPKRKLFIDDNTVVAPVDGKVVVIEEVEENEFFKGKRRQVSIFMSPINVHVTRFPIGGKIVYSKYHPGKYLVAWHPKASEENERTTIVVENENFGAVLYRQIAGAMAKRIVNYAVEGASASQGADSGFIKFGSRVDVFLPMDAVVTVKLNQKVKGGIDVIAK